MPEGDVVWRTAARLHGALAGHRLLSAELRVPALATASLAGAHVAAVVAVGKHLLVRTDDGRTLHSHLRMDGSWHLYRPGTRWRGGPAHEVRVVLATGSSVAVGYRVHDLALVPTAEEARLVGHLGPDVLTLAGLSGTARTGWLGDAAVRLAATPTRGVAEALLDQRGVAGLGLLYVTEACFVAGVSPWTPVAEVARLPRLVGTAAAMLAANTARTQQPTTGSARRGQEHWVFARTGRPCRRCGTRVAAGQVGVPPRQRSVSYCPHCQPGPPPPPGLPRLAAGRRRAG